MKRYELIKKYVKIQIKYEKQKLEKIRKDYNDHSYFSITKSENSSFTEDSPPLPSIIAFLSN